MRFEQVGGRPSHDARDALSRRGPGRRVREKFMSLTDRTSGAASDLTIPVRPACRGSACHRLDIGPGWGGRSRMPPSPIRRGRKAALRLLCTVPGRTIAAPRRHTPIPEAQIDEDLAQLAKVTSCVRTYSVELGLDKVAPLAKKHGLKVFQGIWLSQTRKRTGRRLRRGSPSRTNIPTPFRAHRRQ